MVPAAVLFDMDGLLLDTERVYRALWYEAAERHGIPPASVGYERFIGLAAKECYRLLSMEHPGVDVAAFRQHIATGFQARLLAGDIPQRPGVATILAALSEAGVRRAVVTSTIRSLALKKLEISGLLDRFEGVTGGDEVEHTKPAPDLYLLGARRLGLDPRNCVALEDSPTGMRAALAAGCRAIMIPDLAGPPSGADWTVVQDLPSAIPLILRLSSAPEQAIP
ncbi:MAG: HAD family phosphatase [Alphaproteobacteria bacterium]|nr:HAD family phosphatase [Alphaproteobacteria bacterium]TAD86678.1 MAG: HAD family phosphatase [Alphaproteobacteria bacterium]